MDVSITDSGTIEVGRDHAIKYGVPGASDPVLAGFLLNLAERDGVIVVTHGVIATLVEAAVRIDIDTYLAWMKQREALSVEAVMDRCEKCGWQDTEEIGDHDSMVAGCSNCQEVVCGKCWDKYHADTCGEE